MNEFLIPLSRASLILAVSAGVVWLALRVLKVRSAIVHQAAWSLVLLQGLILFPVALDVPVLPVSNELIDGDVRAFESSENAVLNSSAEPGESDLARSPLGSDAGAENHRERFDSEVLSAAVGPDFTTDLAMEPVANGEPVAGSDATVVSSSNESVRSIDAASGGSVSWPLVASVVWFIGIVVLATRAVWSYVRFVGELRNATPAPQVWSSQWETLLAQQTRQQAKMLCHETLGPMLCRTPTGNALIVPEELWDSLSLEQRNGILRHELGHLQRRDILTGLLARVVGTVHWFNPLVWLAVSRFHEAAEWACDDRAVDESPQQAPVFAKVLLKLVQPAGVPVFGTTSVQGSPLGVRIRRLVASGASDSLLKRGSVFGLLLVLLMAGAFRVNLTQQAIASEKSFEEPQDVEGQDEETADDRVNQFASRIAGTSDLSKRFARVLQTPSGRSAFLKQTRDVAGAVHSQVGAASAAEWIKQNFDKQNGASVFRADRADQKLALLESASRYQENANRVEAAMKKVGATIKGRDEGAALVRRFLMTKNAAFVLNNERLKPSFNPDDRAVADSLNRYFTRDSDGGYGIREEAMPQVEDLLSRLERCAEAEKLMAVELKDYAGEMAVQKVSGIVLAEIQPDGELAPPPMEQRVVRAFEDPLFASFRSLERLFHTDEPVRANVESLCQQIEYMTKDTSRGLVVNEDAKGQMLEWLTPFTKVKRLNSLMQPAVREFANRLAATSPQAKRVKKLLSSRIGTAWVASAWYVEPNLDESEALELLIYKEVNSKPLDVWRALAERVDTVRGGDSLKATLESLSEAHGFTVTEDKLALEHVGIESLDDVTVDADLVLSDISLRSALFIMFEELEGVEDPLTYVIRDGVMHITTQDEADVDAGDQYVQRFNVELLEKMFVRLRRLRRETRVFAELTESLSDADVKRVFTTPAGTLAAMDQIEAMVQAGQVDSLSHWIADHFEETDDGWMPRESAAEAMQLIIDTAKRIEEAKNAR